MPMILNQVSVVTLTVNPNIIAGSAFEFARVQSIYSVGIGADHSGLFCTLQGGADIIAEEFPLPVIGPTAANSPSGAAMTTTTGYPVVPDEMYFTDVLNQGDRFVARVRNPSANTAVVSIVVQISPTGK